MDSGKKRREDIYFSKNKDEKEGGIMNKKKFLISVLVVSLTILTLSSAVAEEFTLLGRPLKLFGYATQGAGFSLINSDRYDTMRGLQTALTNLFAEGDYAIRDDLKFYASGMLTVDWAYQLNSYRDSWSNKLFNQSKDYLNVDDKDWQLLKEARLTWSPGDFMFRVGKQIVAWGEMDGFRLMDQINPLDGRRGFADVEFETTIIPTWLARVDYYPKLNLGWLPDLGFEFVFNPNAEFIPNQDIRTGNDVGGIWAPNVLISGPFPGGEAHLGSIFRDITKPKAFNSDGYEYAFRVKGNLLGSIVTLNYFYGLDNDFVSLNEPIPPRITMASDGKLIIHPFIKGKYPLFRFAGATFSRDVTPLRASFLGDVAPVVRVEAFYAFDNTFASSLNRYIHSDEFRGAIGLDWKVKIPFLNARTYFGISPQFYWRRIIDYPSVARVSGLASEELPGLYKDNFQSTLGINTQYFHGKLSPSFFWLRDWRTSSDFFRFQVVYDHDYHWHLTIGALVFDGSKTNQGFNVFEDKNQLYFKISYKWG